MTLPTVIRIFFAIDLPQNVKKTIAQFIGELKRSAKTNGIRWTRLENLHITLQFLAKINTQDLSQLMDQVQKNIADVKSLTFTFKSLALFPHPYRARVIVLDITPQEGLAKLAEGIGKGIQECQYEVEKRPFRGHLTLGRIKHLGHDLQFLASAKIPSFAPIQVRQVVLFRSEPDENGSRYTVLGQIPLA